MSDIDVSSLFGPIRGRGNCETVSAVTGLEYARVRAGLSPILLSVPYAWRRANMLAGVSNPVTIGGTTHPGVQRPVYSKHVLNVLQQFGCPSTADWPSDVTPTAWIDAKAAANRIAGWQTIQVPREPRTSDPYIAALHASLEAGQLPMIGIVVSPEFMNGMGGEVIPLRGPYGIGHAFPAAGIFYSRRAVLIRNSFGTSWGAAGYGLLAFEWFAPDSSGFVPASTSFDVITGLAGSISFPPPEPPPPTDAQRNAVTKTALLAAVNAITEPPTAEQRDAIIALAGQLIIPPLVPPAVTPVEIVIDNLPPGVYGPSGVGEVSGYGPWNQSSAVGPFGTNSLGVLVGAAPASYTWKTPPLRAGDYDVFVRWTAYPKRSTRVPVTVKGVVREYDQTQGGSVWVLHGRYPYAENERGEVTVTNANGQACADAVRFLRV